MASIPNALRDQIIAEFRRRLCAKMNFLPFPHQAAWWAASEGYTLLPQLAKEGELAMQVRMPDETVEWMALEPRAGGIARVLAQLGAFKGGKSRGAAQFAAAFAAVPGARVQLVGSEYDTCSPEFEYILEALLSDQGMGLKHSGLQNRPRDGRMYLDLPNGARFEARSWERKDALKGKEVDLYLYCEAYQLPGMECYTDYSQNLQKRNGYAVFATTPDRPWVQAFHMNGHGNPNFPDWHCTCAVPRSANPYTFDQRAMDRDNPEKGGLMTSDKFAIAYLGVLGNYVGKVYNFTRGQRQFTRLSHPELWNSETRTQNREDFILPDHWTVVGGADTGTYSSALLVAFDHNGTAFVLDEFPNYRYRAGKIELQDGTIPEWARKITTARARFDTHQWYWADTNSQWKAELKNYGMQLLGNKTPKETRTSIAREYFDQDKIFLAPWLEVLPEEIEKASWPAEATSSGKFEREKDGDHTLDPLEHILSKRPGAKPVPEKRYQSFIDAQLAKSQRGKQVARDSHVGA